MSRQSQKQTSRLSLHTINTPDNLEALRKFSHLFRACAGPRGKNHVVTNTSGGHVTVTGSSQRLLAAMSISRPELKLIHSAVQAHLQRWGDCGGFMSHTVCQLVLRGAHLDVSPFTLQRLYHMFLRIIINHLKEDKCGVKIPAGLDDINVLLSYIRSILSSRSLLNLNKTDCDSLSRCVLKAFLESFPDEAKDCVFKSDRVHCLAVENRQFSDCTVLPGLLLPYPECHVASGNQELRLRTHVIDVSIAERCGLTAGEAGVKVVVFACSLSGDLEEVVEAHFEVGQSGELHAEQLVVGEMLSLCQLLEEVGVGLLLCQKVVHPRVKADLRSRGICFLDRLGAQVMPYVEDLTGAIPLCSIQSQGASLSESLGWLTSVSHQVKFDKSYLHLERVLSPVLTCLLCAVWEEKLMELKTCVKAAMFGLASLLRERRLLAGGGCWQIYACHFLKSKIVSQLSQVSTEMSCDQSTVLHCLTAFTGSLQAWSLALLSHPDSLVMDPVTWHAWHLPAGTDLAHLTSDTSATAVTCSCGLKSVSCDDLENFEFVSAHEKVSLSARLVNGATDDTWTHMVTDVSVSADTVLDNHPAVLSALQQAVSTANLLLSVGQFIVDKN